ncbi:MAG: helix-turn-helix domain-containing protein [Magnetospirillum sp.]|nr:helix-turn-helix domain-containing protein [Magnetospirillum sp.]
MDMTIDTSTLDIPKNPAERRGWVTWQLRNRGCSLTRIALEEGVSVQAVSNALLVPSSHLQSVIAGKLGLTPQQLFPEFHDAAGRRLGKTREPQRTTRGSARNVQEEQAA